MLKVSYIIIFSLALLKAAGAQDIHQVKAFSDKQYSAGEFESALKGYQRVLFFDDKHAYDELYSRIASIRYLMNDFDQAIRYFNLAMLIENGDSIRFEYTFSKALCYFNLGDYMGALNELLDLRDPPSEYLENKKALYMGICYFGLDENENSREYFQGLLDSTGVEELDALFLELEHIKKKYRPRKVELMSMLVPGLGQIYTGETLNGLNSFVLLSGVTGFAVVSAINYGFIDGLLILSSWFYRYYSGGFTNARQFANEKIEREKIEVYSEILSLIEKRDTLSGDNSF